MHVFKFATFLKTDIYIYIYIYIYLKFGQINKTTKRETLSYRKVTSYWFVQLSDIPCSANASSAILQG